MSDTKHFLQWMTDRGGRVTLGEILKTTFAAEYRKHISLLRRMGHRITLKQNFERPSENLYVLI